MSLELQIEALTAAVTKLAEVMAPRAVIAHLPPVIGPTAVDDKPRSISVAINAASDEPKKATRKKAEPKPEVVEVTAPAITREQVATQLIAVVKAKGRDAAVGALKSLGYANVGECPDDKLVDLQTALSKAAA